MSTLRSPLGTCTAPVTEYLGGSAITSRCGSCAGCVEITKRQAADLLAPPRGGEGNAVIEPAMLCKLCLVGLHTAHDSEGCTNDNSFNSDCRCLVNPAPAESGEAGLPDEDDFTHYFNATARLSKENAALRSDLAAAKARGEECPTCRAKREAREVVNGWLAGGTLDEGTPKQWEATARMVFDELKDYRDKLAAAEREIERLKENGIRNASDRSLVLNRVAGERDEARRELEAARGALEEIADGNEKLSRYEMMDKAAVVLDRLAPPKDRP